MTGYSPVGRHLILTGFRFTLDALLVPLSMMAGVCWRFGDLYADKLRMYAPAVIVASIVLPSLTYIGGLYSTAAPRLEAWVRARWFLFSLSATLIVLLGMGSVDLDARVGRGVLLYGMLFLSVLYAGHHFLLPRRFRMPRLRAACLVSSTEDAMAAEILAHSSPQVQVVGVITVGDAPVQTETLPQLGQFNDLESTKLPPVVNTILVRDRHLVMPSLTTVLRRWRYGGIEIMSLADVCEMVLQAVPLPLVTESWMFRASNQSGMLYIKKLKRLFDITMASLFLLLLWPVLLLGMLAVCLSLKGPVFFRQTRMGRLGREFTILKLRSMRVDAEKDGPQWASSGKDSRVFPLGNLLRKYRVDEIPQLFNILRGDMSFVGPRPERPEFIEQLEKEIPFYRERLLVQPGLTGWAQVKYPYGSNVEDAWRKHEFDLYYIKHMSVLLDFFVLLETTRTVLIGGNRKPDALIKAMNKWKKLGPADGAELQPALTKS